MASSILYNRSGLFLTRAKYGDGQEWHTGQILDMTDGARWFHPNNGGAPVKITSDNADALRFA